MVVKKGGLCPKCWLEENGKPNLTITPGYGFPEIAKMMDYPPSIPGATYFLNTEGVKFASGDKINIEPFPYTPHPAKPNTYWKWESTSIFSQKVTASHMGGPLEELDIDYSLPMPRHKRDKALEKIGARFTAAMESDRCSCKCGWSGA